MFKAKLTFECEICGEMWGKDQSVSPIIFDKFDMARTEHGPRVISVPKCRSCVVEEATLLWDQFVENTGWFKGHGKKRKWVTPTNLLGGTESHLEIFKRTVLEGIKRK